MEPYILGAIFLPILLSPLFLYINELPRLRNYQGYISSLIALITLICIVVAGKKSFWNVPTPFTIPWIPSLGINLSFITDGLSLFFGILITVMGILVNLYAQFYIPPEDSSLGRFYCYLTFFMGSMVGAVFSINLMVLFLFWEMTGLASFLLIGYHYEEQKVCNSAKTTFLVTAFTGLSLLAGIILIGQMYGTYDWMYLVNHIDLFKKEFWPSAIIILCFLAGIFGKSAQFPFYFWLPKAMVAPTPVSAYLHAATMVKLGIFLVARMYPLFVTNALWFPVVSSICFLTMLIGATLSLLSHDLKAILAYATISQLGFFIGFYGMGSEEGVQYDFVHILNHALYKGSLFMLVGIVHHSTGIKDIRRLGGLLKLLPFTTILFFLSTAAMAGLPGTIGFLSKEMMLADVVALGEAHHSGWVILGILFTASLFKVAFSIRLFYHLFVRPRKQLAYVFHPPGLAMQLPPAILSAGAFILGVWPSGLNQLVHYFYVSGLHTETPNVIKIWHGWTIELLMSFGIFTFGTLLFFLVEKTSWYWLKIPDTLHLDAFYEKMIRFFQQFSIAVTQFVHSKRPDTHLNWLFLLVIGFVGWQLLPFLVHKPTITLNKIEPIRAIAGITVAFFSLSVLFFRHTLSQLIALSISGLALTLYFVLYEAPDLAMAQVLIEVVTLFLVLIFLNAIKNVEETPPEKKWRQAIKMTLSLGMGCAAFLISYVYSAQAKPEFLKDFFLENSLPLAHGKNAVNTILVDFRGLDTLGEISVLIIACLGAIGLLTTRAPYHYDFSGRESDSIPSAILKNILPLVFFLVNLFAFYLLVRGHDEPGGGFAGGLCCAIAIILIGIVTPNPKRNYFIHVDPLRLTFFGLALVLLVGLSGLFSGSFLTHHYFYWHLPIVGKVVVNTPLIFDTGVFLIVVGMTVKIVFFFRNFVSKERGAESTWT
ncbi:Na(+)/H(+) antiporter subunit A [Chlamydiales bacterium STE3]|nr:Na(+)/H(+) antiporter subunit A [Chlamydiales bacterium STE3]